MCGGSFVTLPAGKRKHEGESEEREHERDDDEITELD